MTEAQHHAASRSGIRALRPAAGVLAVLCCATACASGASTTASGQSSSLSPSATSVSQSSSAAPATSVSPATVDRSTAGAALTDWMRQVVRGNYAAACQDMGGATSSGKAPAPYSAKMCASPSAATTLTALHSNFAVDGITPSNDIKVVAAPSAGPTTTVGGTEIQVSGMTLTSLMVAHSTGVKPGQLAISFTLSRLSAAWYVTDMNLNV